MCRPMYNYLYLSSILCCNSRNKRIIIIIIDQTWLNLPYSDATNWSLLWMKGQSSEQYQGILDSTVLRLVRSSTEIK